VAHQINIEMEIIIENSMECNIFDDIGAALKECFSGLSDGDKRNFSFSFKTKELAASLKDISL